MTDDFVHAISKIERMRQAVAIERRETWTTIQTQAPDVADFLTEINKAFGKPAAVLVKIGGRVILERDEMLPFKYDKYMQGVIAYKRLQGAKTN